MKLFEAKKYLNKLCIMKWSDARGEIGVKLDTLINEGLTYNETFGIIVYVGKTKVKEHKQEFNVVIINTERTPEDYTDYIIVPLGWVMKITELEEKKRGRR